MYNQKSFLQKYWLAILLIVIILVVIVAVALSYNAHPIGAQAQVNVESDIVASNLRVLNGTHRVQYLDWGTLTPNKTYTHTFTVACDNTVKVNAEASEWNPSNATDYMSFNSSTTYGGIVTPYSDINVTFTLAVADYAPEGNFTFTITVIGTDAPEYYVQDYNGWQIYATDAYSDDTTYIAVHPTMKRVLTYVNLSDLKLDIDEMTP